MSYFFVGIFAHICQTLILDIAVVYVFVFVFAIKTKMTDCQDHMPTANIWFVWSKTSYIYSGDRWRCHQCRRDILRMYGQKRKDRATQPLLDGYIYHYSQEHFLPP